MIRQTAKTANVHFILHKLESSFTGRTIAGQGRAVAIRADPVLWIENLTFEDDFIYGCFQSFPFMVVF